MALAAELARRPRRAWKEEEQCGDHDVVHRIDRCDLETQGAFWHLQAWQVVPRTAMRRCQNCGKRLWHTATPPQSFRATLCSTDCLWTLFFAHKDEQRVAEILKVVWYEIDC